MNSFCEDFISGGSSSGSASAVGFGYVDFALGSDTGGSVQQPAILHNIYGFKPSRGMISRYGMIPLAQSLDVVGLMSKDVDLIRDIFLNLYMYRSNRDMTQTSRLLKDDFSVRLLLPEERHPFPSERYLEHVYIRVAYGELYSNMMKYDGKLFGIPSKNIFDDFNRNLGLYWSKNLGTEIARRIRWGWYFVKTENIF